MRLCIEWREKIRQHWNYQTGTSDKSRAELTRLLTAWRKQNPEFEFRIRQQHIAENAPAEIQEKL